jgi:hypothetical protein
MVCKILSLEPLGARNFRRRVTVRSADQEREALPVNVPTDLRTRLDAAKSAFHNEPSTNVPGGCFNSNLRTTL